MLEGIAAFDPRQLFEGTGVFLLGLVVVSVCRSASFRGVEFREFVTERDSSFLVWGFVC